MEQLNNTLFSGGPINLESANEDYGTSIEIDESCLIETKTRTDERLDNLYDIVEKLEYRIVELENKVKELEDAVDAPMLEIDAGYIKYE